MFHFSHVKNQKVAKFSVPLKVHLMQIWKFPFLLYFVKKWYLENFPFLSLPILELFS